MLSTDSAANQRLSTNIELPNTAGNSIARMADGPPTSTVGMTANKAPPRGIAVVDFFSIGASGPKPGFSLASGLGGAFLPDSPSTTVCFNSDVLPLNVLC